MKASPELSRLQGEPTPKQWEIAIGPEPMTLPDGEVFGTTVGDWAATITALIERGWTAEWVRGDTTYPALPVERLFAVDRGEGGGLVRIRSNDERVTLHLWPYDPSTFLFDFDIRELGDSERWAAITTFVRVASSVIGRDVELRDEGSDTVFAVFHASSGSWSLRTE